MMQAKDFTYVSDDLQIAYSAGRNALAEYAHYNGKWHFDGWLYDGQVMSAADAKRLTAEYVGVIGKR